MTYKQIRRTLKSKRWEKFRSRILRRDGYLCQDSLRYGRRVPAEMVHHIYPVSEYPELEFESWNCISLANKVHNSFHDRTSDKIIKNGLYWQKRKKREFDNFQKNGKFNFEKK